MAARGNGSAPSLTLNDLVVLAVLAEEPAHGFALARLLAPGSDLGRILTVGRPQVYRAIDRLAAAELIEPLTIEPGDAGPRRTVYAITGPGRRPLEAWLARPVEHVRDLRVEFLVKLRLLERRRQDPTHLVLAQRRALRSTVDQLTAESGGDVVDRWRAANAEAADRFLSQWADPSAIRDR